MQVHAQLSFHGHRDSVKFFIAVQGSSANIEAAKAYTNAGARPPSPSNVKPGNEKNNGHVMVMSGGEGNVLLKYKIVVPKQWYNKF